MNPITFRPCVGEADGLAHRAEGTDARYFHLRTGTVATHAVLRDAGLGSDCVMPVLLATDGSWITDERSDELEGRHAANVRANLAAQALLAEASEAMDDLRNLPTDSAFDRVYRLIEQAHGTLAEGDA